MTPARVIVSLARAGRPATFVARGGSMWPTVRSGALLELTPCDSAALVVGELAAFERDGEVVVHRLTGRGTGGLRFRGDALPASDGEVAPAQILGRVRVVRQGRLGLPWPRARHLARLVRAVRLRLA